MIVDTKISAGTAVAWVMWSAAIVTLLAMWITQERGLGATSLLFGMIGMTATIRCYFVNLGASMRNSFELGRDSVTPLVRTR